MFRKGDKVIYNEKFEGACPYSKTNQSMISAMVLDVWNSGNSMMVEILEHLNEHFIGERHAVHTRYFIIKSNIDDFLLV